MSLTLLDTDILSEVLKQRNANVMQNAAEYLRNHYQFCISAVTRFGIIRGYQECSASTQLARFTIFCQNSIVLPVTDAIFDRAAELWVLGRQGGYPHNDADLLIASTALEDKRILVTGNQPHFNWIPGLTLEDWRQV